MSRRSFADLHIHTNFSDGRPTPAEVVEHVLKQTDLDIIAITDHDTIEGALRAAEIGDGRGLQVIVGEEVSSRDGHILGLFLNERIRPGLSAEATVEAIHAQGGLAIAAHPFWRTTPGRSGSRPPHGVGLKLSRLPFDAVEVENSTPGLGLANLIARRFNDGLGMSQIGGSDAHIAAAVGKACTSFPGRGASGLRAAIAEGHTLAERRRYDAATLVRYMAWGLSPERSAALAAIR